MPLHETFPEWGDVPYSVGHASPRRSACATCSRHLYVLIPVLDDQKHYWVERGRDREAPPPRRGLAGRASERERHHPPLPRAPAEPDPRGPPRGSSSTTRTDPDARTRQPRRRGGRRRGARQPPPTQRIGAVTARPPRRSGRSASSTSAAAKAGCSRELVKDHPFTEIVGVDVSARSLEIAARRLRVERMNERQRERLRLLQGSLTYRDDRLAGFDAAVLMEVIEHLEPAACRRSSASSSSSPGRRTVVVTTPNAEYNVRFEACPPAASATATTGSSGRATSSRTWADGGRASASATRSATSRSGPRIPSSGRRPRWRCFSR